MSRLLAADDCVLAVIDTQDGFLGKLPEDEASAIVDRVRWLCRLAEWLRVPVVVTEEEPERGLEDADVGLEPAEDDGRAVVPRDVREDRRARGEVEGRLDVPCLLYTSDAADEL